MRAAGWGPVGAAGRLGLLRGLPLCCRAPRWLPARSSIRLSPSSIQLLGPEACPSTTPRSFDLIAHTSPPSAARAPRRDYLFDPENGAISTISYDRLGVPSLPQSLFA